MTKLLCAWVGPHMRLPDQILTDLGIQIDCIPDLTQLIHHMNPHHKIQYLCLNKCQILCPPQCLNMCQKWSNHMCPKQCL
jgi:hypothetical protein